MTEPLSSPAAEVLFSTPTLLGYFLTGLVYLLLPFAACLFMRSNRALRVFPLAAGIVTYFVSVQLNDLTVNLMFPTLTIALRSVIAAVFICFFEETGRYLAIRFPLSDVRSSAAAVCYGIGHGGLECIFRGGKTFRLFAYGTQCSSAGVSYFTDGKTAERAAQITEQLQQYADRNFVLSLMHMLNAIGNFGFHIALSLLMYQRIRNGQTKSALLLAMLLHYALNELYNSAAFLIGEWAALSIGLLCDAGILLLVFTKLTDGREILADIAAERLPDLTE